MLLTLKDVSKELQCTYETARVIIERGDLPCIKLTERNIRIHPDDLLAYIKSKQNEAKQCKQNEITKLAGIKSASETQRVIHNNILQKRIFQRAQRKGKQTK